MATVVGAERKQTVVNRNKRIRECLSAATNGSNRCEVAKLFVLQ